MPRVAPPRLVIAGRATLLAMATIEVNGTSLYYEDTGPGSTGETIAFSHGLLWSTEQFAPQVAALRARYRCISWDHRGQGRSAADPHRQCIGMELVWKDAVALLEALGSGPVHMTGLSMGGFVAMRLAARRPDLVRSLILLATSADPEPTENLGRYRLLASISRVIGARPLRGRVAPLMLGRTFLTDTSRREECTRYVGLMTRRGDIWRAVHGVIDRAGIHDELARIAVPTLVLVGTEDVAMPLPRAQRIVEGIAGARLVQVPRAGHSSPVEEPAAVTAALEMFLRALPRKIV